MENIFKKNGFVEISNDFMDIELYIKENVGIVSLKKFKDDRKAHRKSVNHLDKRLFVEMKEALDLTGADDRIDSVILTSSHSLAFSRGTTVEEVYGASIEKCHYFLTETQKYILNIQTFKKPVIAAVPGLAFGGGFEFVLACDYRIASTHDFVKFGFPEPTLGLIPAMGGTQNLSRLIGKDEAFKLIREASIDMTAQKALDLGVLDKMVAPENLINEAFQFAQQNDLRKTFNPVGFTRTLDKETIIQEIYDKLAKTELDFNLKNHVAPLSFALLELLFEKTEKNHYLNGLLYEFEIFAYLQQTEDCQEGVKALMEKRKAKYKGR